MKKILKEKDIRNIVRGYINEALKYDKERRQYFPDYTGNAHSDAGKYVDNNRDDFNYSRNDYQWSDPEKQKRFNDLQWKNDLEIDPTVPDKDHEDDAYLYLQDREPDEILDKAASEMKPLFFNIMNNFIEKASQKYPILRQGYYVNDFAYKIKDMFEEWEDDL